MTQINVCTANKQMPDKHKDQLPLPQQGDQNAKRTEKHIDKKGRARLNLKRLVVLTTELHRIRSTSGPPL